MSRRSSRLNVIKFEIPDEQNMQTFLKKNLKKIQMENMILNANYSKNTKFVKILYDFLNEFKKNSNDFKLKLDSYYFLFQSPIFQHPLIVVQMYYLQDILNESNILINSYKSINMKPLQIILNNLIEINNNINTTLNVESLLSTNYVDLHRFIGNLKKNTNNESKLFNNLFKLLDEVIDFQNEDTLNNCIPLLESFHL